MRSSLALSAALAAAMLSGCAATPSAPPPPLMSPYPASGYGYGYAEERIGPDLVRVVYYGPVRPLDVSAAPRGTQLDRAASAAADLALWRAAQLALAEGKPAFTVIERRADTETLRRPGGWAYDSWWPDYCYPRYSRQWGCRAWPPSYVPPIADGRARATLIVRLEGRVTPRNIDAAATFQRLERSYRQPSLPPGPPPAPTAPKS
jgi:hypothetical protein